MSNSSIGAVLENVDDTDTRLVYQGSWSLLSNEASDFNSTAHVTSSAGSSVEFTFIGSNIAVYGTLLHAGGNSSYVLDDFQPVYRDSPAIPTALSRQVLYSSNVLSEMKHTLTITCVSSTEFVLDFIQFTTTDPAANLLPSVQPSPSSSSLATHTSSSGLTLGTIIGIAVAVLIALAIALGILVWRAGYCCRRRRTRRMLKRKSEIDIPMSDLPSNTPTAAYNLFCKFKPGFQLPTSYVRTAALAPASQPTTSIVLSSVVFIPPVSTASGGTHSSRDGPSSNFPHG